MFDLFLDTLAALTRARRLVPILIVGGPLVLAQHYFSADANATAIAIVMVVVFLLAGPFSYRALFGEEGFRGLVRRFGVLHPVPWLRLVGFVVLGGLPALIGLLVPEFFGWSASFLTYSVNLAVAAGLFWVGSWGLARDVQQEQSLARERARSQQLALEAEHARLLALEAHLDPHFLFNTLNAIAEWVREDPEHAENALLELSGVLREIMEGCKRPTWPLSREVALVRAVWALHAVRDPERYASDIDLPDPVPAVDVPPMVLLPLAENAVKHGPAKGFDGTLSLTVAHENDHLCITVGNPGPYCGPREGGEGLPMVRKRLALAFGDRARLELQQVDDRTRATVHLPLTDALPAVSSIASGASP